MWSINDTLETPGAWQCTNYCCIGQFSAILHTQRTKNVSKQRQIVYVSVGDRNCENISSDWWKWLLLFANALDAAVTQIINSFRGIRCALCVRKRRTNYHDRASFVYPMQIKTMPTTNTAIPTRKYADQAVSTYKLASPCTDQYRLSVSCAHFSCAAVAVIRMHPCTVWAHKISIN